MNPTLAQLHVNAVLTTMSIGYEQDSSGFVADQVFPAIPVKKSSDTYVEFSAADFFRDEMAPRGPSEESAGGGFNVDNSPSYTTKRYALHKDNDEMDLADADFDLDEASIRYLTQQYLIRKDVAWASAYFKAGVWGTDLTGVASGAVAGTSFLQWNDGASDPIADMKAALRLVQKKIGRKPNTVVYNPEVWDVISDHASVVDRLKYTSVGVTSEMIFATLIGVSKVLVAESIVNSAKEGATASNGFTLSKGAWIGYVAPTPSKFVPSAGYRFEYTGLAGMQQGRRIRSMWLADKTTWRHEIEASFQHKITAASAGAFMASAIA